MVLPFNPTPVFECDNVIKDYYPSSPWGDNRVFAYNLVNLLRPKVIVELGSYLGCSTFAFAQAAKDFGFNTDIYAIDSWEGDKDSGYYGKEIYDRFLEASKSYKNVFTVRSSFDDAFDTFYGGEVISNDIDILHIDGSHDFDSVENDAENWIQLVAENGVVLFHDINVERFGVRQYWDSIKDSYHTIEINNTNGLGVLINSSVLDDYMGGSSMALEITSMLDKLGISFKD